MIDAKVFEARPGISALLLPDSPVFTVTAVSDDLVQATGIPRKDYLGKGFFDLFPANPDDPHFTGRQNNKASLDFVIQHKKPHSLTQQRYDIPGQDGSFTEKYWKVHNVPVLDDAGELQYIIHCSEDITALVGAEKNEAVRQELQKAYNLFLSAPVIIGILRGGDYVIELANEGLLEVWGRTADVVGKPLLQAIPELADQGIIPLLDEVRTTGKPFYANGFPIVLNRNGREEVVYFDFVYKPVYEKAGDKEASGIISVGHDVTAQVLARQAIREDEARYHHLFASMDQGFCILEMIFDEKNKPIDYRFLETNPVFEEQSGLREAVGKTALELVPNLESHWLEMYGKVALTGEAIRFVEGSEAMGRWFEVYAFRMSETSREVALLFTDISERKKSEEALRRSEQNLRNVILQAPIAMSILKGPDFVVEIANSRMYELWGRGKEELLGRPIFQGLPEVREQGFEELLTSVFTTGKSFSASGRPVLLPRDGQTETVYINFLYEPFREPDGTISGIMAVAIDVTEQILSRHKVEESEQQVRALVESAPFPIGVYIGREMRIAFVNQSIIDVWGKGPDIVGKTYAEVLPELESQDIYAKLDHVYTTGIPYHARNQRVDLLVNGVLQSFYFNYSFTPLFDAEGKVYGVMNTAADVTDLEVARQRVEQSEANFRSIVQQAPVAMCILLGPEHIVDIANDMMIELWGKPVEAVMHQPIFKGLPDAKDQGLEALLDKVYHTGEPFKGYEVPVRLFRNARMETVYQNFVYEPYRDANGTILGVLAISIDVSNQVLARLKVEEIVAERTKELAHTNEVLLRTNQELARSNQNLEEFAYAASHDLKEPVRKIHFFSGLLKDNLAGSLNETQSRYFSRIEQAAKRMGALIEDLLTYSHVSKGVTELESIDLGQKVRTVLEDLELEVAEKSAKITIGHLPTIKGHRRQLQQLFQNLIGNALKYSQPGMPPEIEISSRTVTGAESPLHLTGTNAERRYHLLCVSDNGIGFPQEDAERIFNVFTRLQGTGDQRGTGVGLSIARKVVENHHGHIWAESQPGKGSTFHILFPQEL